MTTQPLSYSINGVEQVRLAVTRVSAAVSDFSEKVGGRSLWDRWHEAFFESERELFASEGGTGRSGKWEPLSPNYADWKRSHYPGALTLVASGAMKESLIGAAAGHVFIAEKQTLHIGTEILAGYHWQPSGNRPARRAVDISDEQERQFFGRALVSWAHDLRKEAWDT